MMPLLVLMTAGAVSTSAVAERFEYRKVIMGAEARLVVHADTEEAAQAGATAAFARMEELDAILSDWRVDSELARLVERAGSGPVEVSGAMFTALSRAQEIARAAAGGFDVTVGPYVKLWREARETGVLPTAEALDAARARVGFEKLKLDADAGTVTLEVEGMQLDLGGIGKGIAADAALAILVAAGLPMSLVDFGGDLVLGDAPPGERGWTIDCGCGDAKRRRVLKNCAVATSGDTEQHVEIDGVRYSHLVDPRTGIALTEPLCVTMRAADGATADALASAGSVLGRHAGRALARAFGGEAQILDPRLSSPFTGDGLEGFVPRGGARFERDGGVLVGGLGDDGSAGRLEMAIPSSAFELECEVKVEGSLEAGIVLRLTPEGRGIELALDTRDDGAIGTVRAGGETWHNDAAKNRWRVGKWNHVELRVTGFDPRVEVWLEGEMIADVRPAVEPGAFASCGPLAFSVRGGDADATFSARNVRLRTRDVFHDAPGMTSLFNGEDLTGWEISDERVDGYRVAEGQLELLNVEGSGYLRTVEDYRDFRLRLDFQFAPRTNGGIFLRAARNGENPAYSGCEVQILDDAHWESAAEGGLEPSQRCGSLYGSVGPAASPARPAGEWNRYEVLFVGTRLAVALNGTTLYDVDTTTVPGKPFAERAETGFLGLQRTGSTEVEDDVAVRFRRIAIEVIELTED